METFRSHRGSQTAIFLAGCILSCLLQLVPAKENLTLASVPKYPIQDQSILLNANNLREAFQQCEWTQPSGRKIAFPNAQLTPTNSPQRPQSPQSIELHRNCSLSIKNMKSSDEGSYTLKVTYPPGKQPDTKGPEILIGSIYLTFCDGRQILISVNSTNPRVGQYVVMTPKNIPKNYDFCQWKHKSQSGREKVFDDPGQESKEQQKQKQVVKQDCSLHLTQLTKDDSGDYSIHVEVSSDQNSAKESNREQMKCYRSQTQLMVGNGGSASVKYSAGIIVGALLGSLTWTSSLSFMPLLFDICREETYKLRVYS